MALICIIFAFLSNMADHLQNFTIGAIAIPNLTFLSLTVSKFKSAQKSSGKEGRKDNISVFTHRHNDRKQTNKQRKTIYISAFTHRHNKRNQKLLYTSIVCKISGNESMSSRKHVELKRIYISKL